MVSRKFELYDAFPTEEMAKNSADDLRAMGDKVRVKKGDFGDAGRLKYGIFVERKRQGKRKNR